MKILFAVPYYFPYTSGMTTYVQRLAEELKKRGHKIHVITYKHEKILPGFENVKGVPVERADFLLKFQRGVIGPDFRKKFLKKISWADIVNIHAPFYECYALAKIAAAAKKRIALTYHCDISFRKSLLSRLVEISYWRNIRRATELADKIVVNSLDYAHGSMIKNFLHKTVGIIPPIDEVRFKPEDREKHRKKLGVKREILVGFLGRLTREKGVEFLVRAIPVVNRKVRAKFIIAGEGERVAGGHKESEKSELEKLAKKLKIKNIKFFGFIPHEDLNKYFSALDILVIPSYDRLESFGMVQVEAMLCGTPVVATDMPGVREAILMSKMGIVVEPKNSFEIANAIIEIAKNKKRFVKPRRRLLKIFNTKITADGYDNIFSELVKKSKKRANQS